MSNRDEILKAVTRRQLFKNCVSGIGAVAGKSGTMRKKLGDDPPTRIRTVRGVGYVLSRSAEEA